MAGGRGMGLLSVYEEARLRASWTVAHLVCSIMPLPKAVVLEEISRQGILPTVAPVKP